MPDLLPDDFDARLKAAVVSFWKGRSSQAKRQRAQGRVKDAGTRSSVTGGGHMEGFEKLVSSCLKDAGVPTDAILHGRSVKIEVPGFYRPTKKWDMLVLHDRELLAAIEFKSQVGSIGNNLNNRTEEALGNSLDLLEAYEKGLLKPGPQPWLGWVMVLEDSAKTSNPVRVKEPHFRVDEIFQGASYAQRYVILGRRMLRQRRYAGAAVILTRASKSGPYREPEPELTMRRFVAGLVGHVKAGMEGVK